MISVFIGGSRRLSRVNAAIAERLDNIVDRRLQVLIGDASGFDRAAQTYFAKRDYAAVVVYCTAGKCRNNVADWPVRAIEYNGSSSGFAFYTAKDDAMLHDAQYGLFAWDGVSRGTLRNIRNMATLGKVSAVYLASAGRFTTVRTAMDADRLSSDSPMPDEAPDLFTETWRATG